ncbi:hypothetical protein PCYB_012330 [Plasmodium cynomolgi strain B]|uniref:GRAM domain-containing protein n=1 Tax=Plasmodium cynomolgi (strain B) TaxID=1120755 RepID=K6URM9_PLACD|nr:hypothetical protein PCYB_012330 [Plasmodium cynomolgi strain B]GAB64500.1 hypothetical protein PCYB_012330 [Plasmodium cynomolgi strain B]
MEEVGVVVVTEADMGEADMGEADMGEADVGEADVGEADVGEADVGGADVGGADVGEANVGEDTAAPPADVGEADVGEDTAAPPADDAGANANVDAERVLPIEEQSTKSYDGCSEFSFDGVSEGVLDYIKKTYDKRRKWKLRGRRKWGKKAVEKGAAGKEAAGKEAAGKEAAEKGVPEKGAAEKGAAEEEVPEKEAAEEEAPEKDGSNEEAPNHDVAKRGDKKGEPPNEGGANQGAANLGDANQRAADLAPMLSEENYTYTVPDKNNLDAIVRSSIKTYSCALMKKILLQGKMFITHDSVYFMSLFDSLFSKISIVRIPYESIVAVQKMSVFNFIPNALKIVAKNKSFVFTSFVHRDHAHDFIMHMMRDNRLASEIPKKGVVLYNSEERGEEEEEEEEEGEEGEEEEDDDEEDDEDGDGGGENEATKEPSQGEGPTGQGQPNRRRKKKKRPHLRSEAKSSKKQHDESVVYNITPTQYDILMKDHPERTEERMEERTEELAEERTEERADEEQNTGRTTPPNKEKKEYIVIQTRSETVQQNITNKEEDLMREKNFIKCNYHTDSLHINEDFKKIFIDIFSQFDDKNPFVKNVQDKNPNSLSYEHLNNLNRELQSKGHVSYESVYNISLFDDEKRVFGMPARSDVKENLSFFFLHNVIIIQKCVVLLCSVPLAGCFRTVITLTLHNVLLEGETDNSGGGKTGQASHGGTSSGGTSNGGTSNGGTSNGGTSNGGTSNAGTPCTHIDFAYDIEFIKHTFFKYQIKNNALPELEISVNNLKRYTQEAIERRYIQAGATNRDNNTQTDHYTFVKDYVDIMTIGEEKTFDNTNSTGPAETAVQSNDSASSAEPLHTAAWSTAKRYFKAEFNPLSQSVRHRLVVRSFLVSILAIVMYKIIELIFQSGKMTHSKLG